MTKIFVSSDEKFPRNLNQNVILVMTVQPWLQLLLVVKSVVSLCERTWRSVSNRSADVQPAPSFTTNTSHRTVYFLVSVTHWKLIKRRDCSSVNQSFVSRKQKSSADINTKKLFQATIRLLDETSEVYDEQKMDSLYVFKELLNSLCRSSF